MTRTVADLAASIKVWAAVGVFAFTIVGVTAYGARSSLVAPAVALLGSWAVCGGLVLTTVAATAGVRIGSGGPSSDEGRSSGAGTGGDGSAEREPDLERTGAGDPSWADGVEMLLAWVFIVGLVGLARVQGPEGVAEVGLVAAVGLYGMAGVVLLRHFEARTGAPPVRPRRGRYGGRDNTEHRRFPGR